MEEEEEEDRGLNVTRHYRDMGDGPEGRVVGERGQLF